MRNAIFISVWDGATMIESSCKYDETSNTAYDIEQIDVDGMDLNVLEDQYLLFDDGEELHEFNTEE